MWGLFGAKWVDNFCNLTNTRFLPDSAAWRSPDENSSLHFRSVSLVRRLDRLLVLAVAALEAAHERPLVLRRAVTQARAITQRQVPGVLVRCEGNDKAEFRQNRFGAENGNEARRMNP